MKTVEKHEKKKRCFSCFAKVSKNLLDTDLKIILLD